MSKDWTGNSRSSHTCLGSSVYSETDRAEHDLYTTSQHDFGRFLKALNRDGLLKAIIKPPVWECSAGLLHLVEVMQKMKWDVVASDLVDRSEWENFKHCGIKLRIMDFLKDAPNFEFNTILTNPPFKYATEFVRRGIELLPNNGWLVLLLRIQWLEGINRLSLFKEIPYSYVYVYSARAGCSYNGVEDGKSSAVCYGWFLYHKNREQSKIDPIIKFIE